MDQKLKELIKQAEQLRILKNYIMQEETVITVMDIKNIIKAMEEEPASE